MNDVNLLGGLPSKVYCCLPVQNWLLCGFQFTDGYLTLIGDEIEKFETMLKGVHKRHQLQVRDLSQQAYDIAMKDSRFRRERLRILGPEASSAMKQSEILVGSADEAVMAALADEEAMQRNQANNLAGAAIVPEKPKPEELPHAIPAEGNVGGQAMTEAKEALLDSKLTVDPNKTETEPTPEEETKPAFSLTPPSN